jgi:hypothetical protein
MEKPLFFCKFVAVHYTPFFFSPQPWKSIVSVARIPDLWFNIAKPFQLQGIVGQGGSNNDLF